MRFISPISAYKLVAVHQDTVPLANGTTLVRSEGFTAEFKQSDTTDWERDEARVKLKFRGTTRNFDGSEVDPITRVSSFDTATIKDPELRAKVEEAFLSNDDFGKQDGYILVEKPKIEAPWKTYDELRVAGKRTAEHVAQRNLALAEETGVSTDTLIAYERENRNDPKIIAVYEASQVPEPEQVLVTA